MENVPCVMVREVVGAAGSDDGSHLLLQIATDMDEIKLVMPREIGEEVITNLLGAAASTSRVGINGDGAKAIAASVAFDPQTDRPSLLVETEYGPVSFDLAAGALLSLSASIARYAIERQNKASAARQAA